MAHPPPTDATGNADPSMDDILASIRRILSDEEKAAAKAQPPSEGVFVLDPSMMVDDSTPPPPGLIAPEALAPQAEQAAPPAPTQAERPYEEPPAPVLPPPTDAEPATEPVALVAPEAAAAAASSVSVLMRTLVSERATAVSRGGPTLEDLVREEMRPLLKQWLDAHLPGIVERLVRTEIERVVGRIAG